ncbi:MAG: hypothetical protein DBX41_00160 [Clostridiales bacterium]|nr:MAG: hypothetical protein DBX41_00160 [Clostridiales bacterium]
MMKITNYLRYGLRDTFRALWRHKAMVAVTVLTVAITFMVLGAAVLISANGQYIEQNLENDMEIVVFLDTDVTVDERGAIEQAIQSLDGFDSMRYVTKDEALTIMGERFGGETGLTNALGGTNPLPDAYYVKMQEIEKMPAAAAVIENLAGVELVRYGQDTVQNMSAFSKALWGGCIAIIAAMVVAALVLVNSTIRLTVSARSEEIAIMKYIGATDFYVKIPFFLEGVILGIIGGAVAFLLLYFGYGAAIDYAGEHIAFLSLITDRTLVVKVGLYLLLGGAVLGGIGSNIAVRKYLRV